MSGTAVGNGAAIDIVDEEDRGQQQHDHEGTGVGTERVVPGHDRGRERIVRPGCQGSAQLA